MSSCWEPCKNPCRKNKKRGLNMNKKQKEEKSFKNKKTIPQDIPIVWVNI